jgi:hypothetical protein
MTDIQRLLERQAKWQKSRRSLSWPEKVRMAEAMREAIHHLRGGLAKIPSAQTGPQSGREA